MKDYLLLVSFLMALSKLSTFTRSSKIHPEDVWDSTTASNVEKPTLAFMDVSYSIPSRFWREKKTILKPLSGIMKPGLNAIMGPTGSGKTTFLDILADRKARSHVDGVVFFNSKVVDPDFRFNMGYVVQDDIVTGSLTVRENLLFSAHLRLPSSTTMTERKLRVERVINELELQKCANRKIGTDFVRGVSGGERRRTSIGMELITEPKVLFLDEPTTGLDAQTAETVMKILKRLALSKDRIVIMSIHQPRYSIFKLFDTLTLLSSGDLVYHGPGNLALDYFNKLGFECDKQDNPADFFLDVIKKCELKEINGLEDACDEYMPSQDTDLEHAHSEDTGLEAVVVQQVPFHGTDPKNGDSEDSGLEAVVVERIPSRDASKLTTGHTKLGKAFENSDIYRNILLQLQLLLQLVETAVINSSSIYLRCSDMYARNVFCQLLIVIMRSGLKMLRVPMTSIIQVVVNITLALIVGGLYYQRPDTPRGMQDRFGVLFFVVLAIAFSNLSAVELFIRERSQFLHEASSGYYRVSVYFMGKVLTDFMILRLIPLSLFSIITYSMIGLQLSIEKFFIYYLTLLLTTLSGAAIAFAFSAMVSMFSVANLMVSLVFIIYMLFGGFLIGLNSIPVWIRWIKFISVFRYSTEALAYNELQGQVYTEILIPNSNGIIDQHLCPFTKMFDIVTNETLCIADGDSVLQFRGYSLSNIWYDELAIFCHAVIWLLFTYFILRIVKKYYRHFK